MHNLCMERRPILNLSICVFPCGLVEEVYSGVCLDNDPRFCAEDRTLTHTHTRFGEARRMFRFQFVQMQFVQSVTRASLLVTRAVLLVARNY